MQLTTRRSHQLLETTLQFASTIPITVCSSVPISACWFVEPLVIDISWCIHPELKSQIGYNYKPALLTTGHLIPIDCNAQGESYVQLQFCISGIWGWG